MPEPPPSEAKNRMRKMLNRTGLLFSAAVLIWSFVGCKPEKPQQLDPNILAEWQKVGGKSGWCELDFEGSLKFHSADTAPQPGWLPAFEIRDWKTTGPKELPSPKTPFALMICDTEVKEKDSIALLRHEQLTKLKYVRTPTILEMKTIGGSKNLTAIDFGDTCFRGEGLRELGQLSDLVSLNLFNSSLAEEFTTELAGLKNLRRLNLGRTVMTDEGLKSVSQLGQLEWLNLQQTRVKDGGLNYLTKLGKLEVLDLGYNSVTDAGLKELGQMKQLVSIVLDDTDISDAGLKALADLPNLIGLHLNYTRISDTGLKEVLRHKQLISLALNETQVTDAGMKELTKLDELSSLSLIGTKVSDAGLKELAQLKKLTWINLSKTKVTAVGINEFRKILPGCSIVD